MRSNAFAILADVILLALIVVGAVWLFVSGMSPGAWTSDRPLLPLSVEGAQVTLLVAAVGIILGLVLAWLLPRARDRVVNGDVVRYRLYERLVHWALALGYVLAFVTGAWLLRWLSVQTNRDILPSLYLVHYIGAALIVFAAGAFVTSARVRGEDALFPRWRDVSPAVARLFSYLGIYGQPGVLSLRWPRSWQEPWQRFLAELGIRPAKAEGKFLSVEKVLSFAPLAILTFIVVGTGLVKAVRYFFQVPGDVYYWATWLHDLSAWFTLVVVGVHIVAIFLVPRNWPGIRAMISGRISQHVVEEEFPAWAESLRSPDGQAAEAEGAAAPGAKAVKPGGI
ncbi:MAG: cytochrome b/b6 domain-containing protein [Chloroflexota bacterium]|nr:cytochrome b/b6 domain-containing protein [Chloroflexota bacterium]